METGSGADGLMRSQSEAPLDMRESRASCAPTASSQVAEQQRNQDQVSSPRLNTMAGDPAPSPLPKRRAGGKTTQHQPKTIDSLDGYDRLLRTLGVSTDSDHSSSSSRESDRTNERVGARPALAGQGRTQAQGEPTATQEGNNDAKASEGSTDTDGDQGKFPLFPVPSVELFSSSVEEQRRVMFQLAAWFGFRLSVESLANQLPHVRKLREALAQGKSIEEVKIIVKTKRRPDPGDPNPLKRPRRSWTSQEKETILRASQNGPATLKLVADVMGMKITTARDIVQRARAHPEIAVIDRRTGPHPNHPTKRKDEYLDWLRLWLEENCTLPLKVLLTALNQEISRAVLVKYGALTGKEKEFGTKISFERHPLYETNESAKAEYLAQRIKSHTTIGRWLANTLFTRKVAIQERSTANNDANKLTRLKFCLVLHRLMDASEATLIFTDEMPFYIRQMRTYGRSPIGTRAKVQAAPGSKLALRAHVALAVHPRRGVLHDVVCPPEQLNKSKLALKPNTWRHQWDKIAFVSFMDGLFTKLTTTIDEERNKGHDILGAQDIYVLFDRAAEHVVSALSQVVTLESYKELKAQLSAKGNDLAFLQLPPISPMLNLTEYYNRALRGISQQYLDKPECQSVFLNPPNGVAITSRLRILQDAIESGISSIKENFTHSEANSKLDAYVKDVIAREGELDFSKLAAEQ